MWLTSKIFFLLLVPALVASETKPDAKKEPAMAPAPKKRAPHCVAKITPKNGAVYLESPYKNSLAQVIQSEMSFKGAFEIYASEDAFYELDWTCPGTTYKLIGKNKCKILAHMAGDLGC